MSLVFSLECINRKTQWITGHGVSSELRARLLERLVAFFALPADRKTALHCGKSSSLRGYESVGEQRLEAAFADQKEGFMIGADLPNRKPFSPGAESVAQQGGVPRV
ncbi:hypothetical protein B0H66DRAFT_599322 [Apodospora peruviana]|uniref:Non-haem dioxygenase N-terminal domain-containing protein n=1 Tax=Apodospora peruviana TaxID=516989 RepID=A0AAE0II41_9PEZI|nr:hypothetical protein B0H66DRAFT_599322 [Apodospora peruviana]